LIVVIDVNLLYRTSSRKRKLSSQDETLEEERNCFHQQFHPGPPNLAISYQQQQQQCSAPWLGSPYNSQPKRKSSITNLLSNKSPVSHQLEHMDHKPDTPFSPPHQSYDHHRLLTSNINSPDHYYYYEKMQHSQQYYQHIASIDLLFSKKIVRTF
jgi:hypothetical protein